MQVLHFEQKRTTIKPYSLLSSNSQNFIDSIFLDTVRKIESKWNEFFLIDRETDEVKNLLENNGVQRGFSIDYKKVSYFFNKAFFLKNLYKNLILFYSLQQNNILIDLPLFDIGSGAGPSTISWCLLNKQKKCKAYLIDQSLAQLIFARRIAKILDISGLEFINQHVNSNFHRIDGTAFLSYWYCEQVVPSFIEDPLLIKKIITNKLLILDYPQNVELFEKQVNGIFSLSRLQIESKVSKEIDQYIHHNESRMIIYGCFCESK